MQDSLALAAPARRDAPPWTPRERAALMLGGSAVAAPVATWLISIPWGGDLAPALHAWAHDPQSNAELLLFLVKGLGLLGFCVAVGRASQLDEADPNHEAPQWRSWRAWREVTRPLLIVLGVVVAFQWGLPWALGLDEPTLLKALGRHGPMPYDLVPSALESLLWGLATLVWVRRNRVRATALRPILEAAEWHGPKGA